MLHPMMIAQLVRQRRADLDAVSHQRLEGDAELHADPAASRLATVALLLARRIRA